MGTNESSVSLDESANDVVEDAKKVTLINRKHLFAEKVNFANFPLGCLGKILLYVSDSSVAFSVLKCCKGVKLYLDKTNPGCLKNVQFNKTLENEFYKKKKGKELKKKEIEPRKVLFVHKLKIQSDVSQKFWKKERSLITKANIHFMNLFPCLIALELDGCLFTETSFAGVSNLHQLRMTDCPHVGSKEEAWKCLTKLRILSLKNCDGLSDSILEYIPKLQSISVTMCDKFEVDGFKYLKVVRSVVVKQCCRIEVRQDLYELLPDACKDIEFESDSELTDSLRTLISDI